MELTPRFFSPPKDHFFLLGPRGTGKTWWTKQRYPGALRIDLLEPATLRELAARPERLREVAGGRKELKQIVIDEVQKLPELLEVVHAMIEERSGIQFILTGSSARKLRRSGVNLLGGRAANRSLHPFMAAEIGDAFGTDYPEAKCFLLYCGTEGLLIADALCLPCSEFLPEHSPSSESHNVLPLYKERSRIEQL